MRCFRSAFLLIAIPLAVFSREPDRSLWLVAGRVVTAAEGTPLKTARVVLVLGHQKPDTHVYGASSDGNNRLLLVRA